MKVYKWFPLFVIFALVGCETVPMAASVPVAEAVPVTFSVPMASSDLDAAGKTFAPPEGIANIYVFRQNKSFGGSIVFQVLIDGKVVGAIARGTFYLVELQPGYHSIAVFSNENAVKAKFEAVAGTNSYFEVAVAMGSSTARAVLSQIKEDAAGRQLVQAAKRAEGFED
jgi:hypothetical protein